MKYTQYVIWCSIYKLGFEEKITLKNVQRRNNGQFMNVNEMSKRMIVIGNSQECERAYVRIRHVWHNRHRVTVNTHVCISTKQFCYCSNNSRNHWLTRFVFLVLLLPYLSASSLHFVLWFCGVCILLIYVVQKFVFIYTDLNWAAPNHWSPLQTTTMHLSQICPYLFLSMWMRNCVFCLFLLRFCTFLICHNFPITLP